MSQKRVDEGEGPITSINVTPLVDICLVLVIIFMLIAPFAMQAGIRAAQTKAGAAVGITQADSNVAINLTPDTVTVNGKTVAWETLPITLTHAIAKSKDKLVSVTATPDTDVGRVVDVLDTSKQMGAKKLAIMKKED